VGFKRQVVEEIESGLLRPVEAARKYDVSPSLIDRWQAKYHDGTLVERPTTEELSLRAENERLKIKVAELTMQFDLLKKRMDYERRQKKERSSIVTGRNLAVFAGGAQ
jgi:transposase-like protein